MLISLIREEKPTHIAVAFDVSRKTFRTELFPEYKANRASTPDEFRSQIGLLHELVSAFGISQFEREGFEADDILATLSTQASKEDVDVIICSGDRDTFQLVTEKITVLYPKRGVSDLARMTPEAVLEKYAMSPTSYPDFAALRGDPSDNLPSIPGVGEKTAQKWIIEYGSLTNLIAHAADITGKVGDSLRANIAQVLRNRELTQLLHEVPLEVEIGSLLWAGVDEAKTNSLFEQLEFRTLKDRIAPLLAQRAPASQEATFILFDVPTLENFKSSIEATKAISAHNGDIAIACEIFEEKVIRYAIALSSSEVFVVDSNVMGEWISNRLIGKIVHDGKSLARILPIAGIKFCTALAAYLVNPGVRAQEFSDIAQRWGDGREIGSLSCIAQSLFALMDSLAQEMKDRGVDGLYRDLELPVAQLLAAMERRGVAIDPVQLSTLQRYFLAEVEKETMAAHESAGHEFNVASPKQLQVVLFDELKLPKTKKIKTGFTTDAESLEWLAQKTEHPILRELLRIRETNKLRTTVEGLISEASVDGRIHTHFQQTVTSTGRLSSTGPNLQNIPVRTQEGRKIRECFVAGKGYVALLTADYSQIEMRIMAHLSDDAHLLAAFASGEDLHASVAAEVFEVAASDVDAEMRRQIKAMSYGLAYGLSSYGLSTQLGISPSQAQELMDRYFQRFGGIRDYLSSVVEQARIVGYTETIMGRRRYLPDLLHDNRQRREIAERMALNAPIQGSAADIIKAAMLTAESAINEAKLESRLLLQVHDELIFEVAKGEEDLLTTLVRSAMGSAYALKAPLAVSVGLGRSWNEAAH